MQRTGATTLDDYRKYIEKDAALSRRFQPVMVMSRSEQRPEIRAACASAMRTTTRWTSAMRRWEAAVSFSSRYINDRQLPDKAVDLMDEAVSGCACAHARRSPTSAN